MYSSEPETRSQSEKYMYMYMKMKRYGVNVRETQKYVKLKINNTFIFVRNTALFPSVPYPMKWSSFSNDLVEFEFININIVYFRVICVFGALIS